MRTSKTSSGDNWDPPVGMPNEAEIRRPIDEKVLKKAKQIARQYRVIVEPAGRAGYIGRSIEMPGVMADGKTPAACIEAMYESLAFGVAVMLEMGETPPLPCNKRRDSQINVRVTAEEKFFLEDTARRRGFKGISDFLRALAMRECHAAGA
ncbi:MAG TPA: type II toxin-antitoxin system HicB family antitoxin [Phycisphaerae bacterium]|jgi:predicted RNase H-like HicB family nuclease|nr:type II toxin-antitoxin system HicB family antitoxin [Phycisphaerae bacterium]HOB74359.1 type II toxin-antitoxin system HicB family antitoxin [Phycisphaerae bacterium]HOJ54522.1 type II toxin-antitoxin system HicB family antitoxin [Phycisphaerae bacterium]HOL26551.1 type II toxin-antitoxin system HicB family antitoxin [Phycisphaerae bacterium]HPP20950.1 type II toxin-antitoxin system HicB family antitoxin [Phycisphaerae bacterium]